jgi:hypothetical protein
VVREVVCVEDIRFCKAFDICFLISHVVS